MNKIFALGISHKTAPVELREKISFPKEALQETYNKLLKEEIIHECLILSTCNRVEIFVVADDDSAELILGNFLSEYHNLSAYTFSQHFYSLRDHDAIRHMFRVAASMESMVVGEPQILGQVKESYNHAVENGSIGLVLHKLMQSAFSVAKKIRNKTQIGAQSVSVSFIAVELANRIFEDLSKRTVLLVGTGEMTKLAARHLINSGLENVIISSRNFTNSCVLAEELRGVPIRFEEIYYRLKDVDIVITATSANEYIFKENHIKESLKLRKNEPMFFIDIAVPRDVDPRVNDMSGVYLYDIDDLQDLSKQSFKNRKSSAIEAEEIVEKSGDKFVKWLESIKVVPTIIKLKNKVDQIKESEMEKALNKLQNLSEEEREVIIKMVNKITSKILHDPLTNLKRENSSHIGTLYSETLNRLYELNFPDEVDIDTDLNDESDNRNKR